MKKENAKREIEREKQNEREENYFFNQLNFNYFYSYKS